MARLPRLTLPGYVHHVLQRGSNRQPIFADAADHTFMLGLLNDNARRYQVNVHAYVLMPDHFHLLMTPTSATALPQMMQAMGRSYVRYFNDRHGRFGTLWEGRYRSTLLEVERYLLRCMAYIDLNPVRSGLVAQAEDYPWSSYRHYAGNQPQALLTPHPYIWTLGNTPFAREAAYTEQVQDGVGAEEAVQLTQSVLSGWPLGDIGFVSELERQTLRRVMKAKAGRPTKPVVSQTEP